MWGNDVVSQTGTGQNRQKEMLTERSTGMVEKNSPSMLENTNAHVTMIIPICYNYHRTSSDLFFFYQNL